MTTNCERVCPKTISDFELVRAGVLKCLKFLCEEQSPSPAERRVARAGRGGAGAAGVKGKDEEEGTGRGGDGGDGGAPQLTF